jgi:hypothetical protein
MEEFGMSHTLKKYAGHHIMRLEKPYAAVKVERKGKRLVVIPGSICLVKPGTEFAVLYDHKVVSEDGETLQPSGVFYISTETFDPYHLVIDWMK